MKWLFVCYDDKNLIKLRKGIGVTIQLMKIIVILMLCYCFPLDSFHSLKLLINRKWGHDSKVTFKGLTKSTLFSKMLSNRKFVSKTYPIDDFPPPTDPWKVLIKKLDSTKAPKNIVGKIENQEYPIVDELKCPHFGECSGCTIKGKFIESPIIRRSKLFFQRENIPVNIHIGNITQWRTNVKLAVQPSSRWGGIKIGLYKVKSHIVEAIPDCRVHHPIINIGVENIKLVTNSLIIFLETMSPKHLTINDYLQNIEMFSNNHMIIIYAYVV